MPLPPLMPVRYPTRILTPDGWMDITAPSPSKRRMVATWQGTVPTTTTPGVVWRVPYLDGVAFTFALQRAYGRVETAALAATSVVLEKSPAGAFVPSTITTLTLASLANEIEATAGLGSVASGQLLRIRWTALGASGSSYTIELEGVES
jgi:hypothetical protein